MSGTSVDRANERTADVGTPMIQVEALVQHFRQSRFAGGRVVHALNGVDLTVRRGETLGIVGETGCGKSTLCRAVMRLSRPTSGRVHFAGEEITDLPERRLKHVRRSMQMVFQDPADSMNPRLTVGHIVEEPLVVQTSFTREERRRRVSALLADVGLPVDAYERYPHEFSGGQRQRIAIARALALDPSVLICDEPVSALDVSIQSQVLNLLLSMQAARDLSMIFVSHALSVVRHMSDRVIVMYLGSVMESAPATEIYRKPLHPYTQALIAAIPEPDPTYRRSRAVVTGEIPSPIDLPTGCPFHLNCPLKVARCVEEKPEVREVAPDHHVACHLV